MHLGCVEVALVSYCPLVLLSSGLLTKVVAAPNSAAWVIGHDLEGG